MRRVLPPGWAEAKARAEKEFALSPTALADLQRWQVGRIDAEIIRLQKDIAALKSRRRRLMDKLKL